jgi:RNA polymerase primary sigma factor/RNA polymerase sigma factor
LISRRFVLDGRKRVGFLQSSVDRFVAENRDRVRRGGEFSQLSDDERAMIVDRARRLAHVGACPAESAAALTPGRSVETIRYTKQFVEHPECIFPTTRALQDEVESTSSSLPRAVGLSKQLAGRRPASADYQRCGPVHDGAPARLHRQSVREIHEKAGRSSSALPDATAVEGRLPAACRRTLPALYEVPLLTREQRHLFRKMNYLKYKQPAPRSSTVRPKRGHGPDRGLYRSRSDQNEIISANLRLVVSIAKRHVGPVENFFELVSDGNISLIRAVEKFDFARGNKFSTYVSWAIMKNFARTIPDETARPFRTNHAEMFTAPDDGPTSSARNIAVQRESRWNSNRLDERERKIIIRRFGLSGEEPSPSNGG